MIESITLQNTVTSESIDIVRGAPPYVLDSIDWDEPAVTMESYRVPFQIGKSISGVTVGTRKPAITGYIVADMTDVAVLGMTWEDYYKKQKEMIEESKERLDRFISIYHDMQIIVGDYYLVARPTSPPKYSADEKINNEVLCYFEIEMECFNPLFHGKSRYVDLASITPLFHFPLVFPEGSGVVFGNVAKKQSAIIENKGDVPVGCTIEIRARGGQIKNPKIYNVETGEYIEFEETVLDDGDSIRITTSVGEENAVMHDASLSKDKSLIGFLKTGSKFLQISRGSTYYAHSVADEYANSIEVSITYDEQFFNIRGM